MGAFLDLLRSVGEPAGAIPKEYEVADENLFLSGLLFVALRFILGLLAHEASELFVAQAPISVAVVLLELLVVLARVHLDFKALLESVQAVLPCQAVLL